MNRQSKSNGPKNEKSHEPQEDQLALSISSLFLFIKKKYCCKIVEQNLPNGTQIQKKEKKTIIFINK